MSYKKHFIELKKRILLYCVFFMAVFVLCYIKSHYIYNILLKPLYNTGSVSNIIYTNLTDAFFTYLKTALFTTICLTFPFLLWQIYLFVAPGLYLHEKKTFVVYLIFSPLLFLLGALLAYCGIMPIAWHFLTSFADKNNKIIFLPKIDEYLSLAMSLIFGFGAAFQMPLLLSIMSKANIINANWLRKKRRIAIILIFLIAAILTPPDILSQIYLAIPLMLLYEVSIALCSWQARSKHLDKLKINSH
ncbi:Sec-independent protein translocase protein TatC [Candidatus Xenohaliotis californiensis]|uniref:Sec-independent protein translocase protein TatC n=1 Tax=Candidatus Xenohaliotis californiensis TaxID=84677 RepID=A0ABP0ETF1_9RICK|nr:Sec-independent protein translocase protein TatC [Candidatus Xenohaliotis californiensis]